MWKPVDTEFFVPLLPVSLVHISGGGLELTRAALEALGCVVLAHRIETPSDFLKVLGQGDSAPRYMVILGHGDENGFAGTGDQIRPALDRSSPTEVVSVAPDRLLPGGQGEYAADDQPQ